MIFKGILPQSKQFEFSFWVYSDSSSFLNLLEDGFIFIRVVEKLKQYYLFNNLRQLKICLIDNLK
jgi:hypothetical protein